MIIKHRILFSKKNKNKRKLEEAGIILKSVDKALFFFDIKEDDALWPKVKVLMEKYNIKSLSCAEFTEAEVLSAKWLIISPQLIQGYPMPSDDFGFTKVSHDAKNMCAECGIGLKQVAPFLIEKEPKLERCNFYGINWLFDIFATTNTFEILRQNNIEGYETLPVMQYRTNKCLEGIQQLIVPEKQTITVIGDNLPRDNCSCGHIKYEVPRMVIPQIVNENNDIEGCDFAKTDAWFGSGHAARRELLVSNKFVQLYYEQNWKGLSFWPTEIKK